MRLPNKTQFAQREAAFGLTYTDRNSMVVSRRLLICLITTVVLVVCFSLIASRSVYAQVNQDLPQSPFVAVGQAVRPSVVNIRITRSVTDGGVGMSPLKEMYRQFFPDEAGKGNRFEMPSTGSGFVVQSDGDILTNNHVIAGADEIFVRFSGEKREYRAELVGTDPNTDLALIKINLKNDSIEALPFGNSEQVEVGSWAIAVGNPFGNLESSLTVGVVSAKGRGGLVIAGGSPRYQDFIQTDASINFGNSGGPLVNIHGQLIGVNTAINSEGQGIGFAVPSNMVAQIYQQLLANGRVIRGYLGVRTEDVVQVVGEEEAGVPEMGARVISVIPDSPAAEAGILAGDIIVKFAGKNVESQRHLLFLIAGSVPDIEVTVDCIRDGSRNGIRVRPVEWIDENSELKLGGDKLWLGMEVVSLEGNDPRVARLKDTLGVTEATGVIVVAVQEELPAAEAGIRPGDVLVSIEGREIEDLNDFQEIKGLFLTRNTKFSALIKTGSSENYVMIQPRYEGIEN